MEAKSNLKKCCLWKAKVGLDKDIKQVSYQVFINWGKNTKHARFCEECWNLRAYSINALLEPKEEHEFKWCQETNNIYQQLNK